MRHYKRALFAFVFCIALAATNAFAAVGRTPGAFNVSSTGAATYTIPIWVPPGPKGIQPNLALTYNNQSSGGIVGPGWSLSGLGAITRCNKTYAQDTTPSAVTLSTSDGYCLNGNRLRLTGGTYGTAGSTYQTEVADFSNVTAYSAAGNGPAYFIVQAKNGLIYEYGNSADSRITPSSTVTTAYQWLLNKVRDRAGNNYVVTYDIGTTGSTGIGVPRTISWTPSAYNSTTYSYSVNFAYSSDSDTGSESIYVSGILVENTNRLDSITVKRNTSTIRKYALAYEVSPITARYRLQTVTECTDDVAANCLSPTMINYQNGATGVATSAITALSSAAFSLGTPNFPVTKFDFNGDGRSDLAYYSNGVWYVSFATTTGYTSPINTGVTNYGPVGYAGAGGGLMGSILSNGTDGLLSNQGGIWWYYTWNGSSFSGVSTGIPVETNGNTVLADVNGDGLPDLVASNGTLYTRLNTSTGTGSTPSFASATSTTIPCTTGCYISTASGFGANLKRKFDFNGDGLEDILISYQYWTTDSFGDQFGHLDTYIAISTSSNFSTVLLGNWTPEGIGNFNDDSCDDFLTNQGTIYISQCSEAAAVIVSIDYAAVVAIMDWNGDGRSDLVVHNHNNGYLGVYLSTGTGFSNLISTSVPDPTITSSGAYFTFDQNGDGLEDLGLISGTSPYPIVYYPHNGAGMPADLVTAIVDGYGFAYSPNYVSIAQSNYTKGTGTPYPDKDIQYPLYVVSQFTASDGAGGTYTQAYNYTGARQNAQGRGFEGFQSITMTDSRANTPVVKTYYRTDFPYAGMVTQQDTYQHDGVTLISHTINTLALHTLDATANNQRYWPYVSTTTTNSYEVGGTRNGQLITTRTVTANTPDNYGNFQTVIQTATDNDSSSPYYNQSWIMTTTNSITNDPGANWCLGLPSSVTVAQSASNGEVSVSRATNYTVDYINCRTTQQVVAPGTAYQVTTALGYDSFGNINNKTVTGYNMAARTTTANWGSTGQFPISVTNALSQTTSAGYDYNLGLQNSQTDANNLITSWQYDAFGRKTLETRPDSTSTLWGYSLCSGCDPLPRMVVTTQPRDASGNVISTKTDYFDMLDRPLYQVNQLLDGSTAWTVRNYDVLGNVLHDYFPYLSTGGNNGYITYSYDALNRVTSKQPSSGASLTTQYQYAGRTTTVIDANSHATTTITDVNGWTRKTTDANGYTITNAYDAAGSLVGVTDNQSGTLFSASYAYGIQPFKTASWDSDLGPMGYTPNALGEVVGYTDAKNQNFNMLYDPLSRPTQRTEAEGITTWTWGNNAAAHEIGQLHSVSSPGYSETYAYDGAGRLSNRQITSDTTYNYDFTYNTQGTLDTQTYPTSTSGYRLKLQYAYQTGLLKQVKDYNASTIFWQANAMSPRGQLTQEQLGNGIVTNHNYDAMTGWLNYIQCGIGGGACSQNQSYLHDNVGNVTQRQNNNLGLTENFNYDAVNRLTSSTLNGTQNLAVSYDGQGNITSRSDVGSFNYTTQQVGCGSYVGYTPQPHAVRNAGGNVYCYDKNGNMTSRAGNNIAWTSYNYPYQIASSGETINLYYDANRQRYKQV